VCEVVEPIFSCAAAPHIHPFVNPSAENSNRPEPCGADTDNSGSTVSRTRAVSIKETLGKRGRVHWQFQTGLGVREGLFFKEEGPMQPYLPSLTSPCVILALPGETESSSAGEQLDKG
jgi:hypothetical protein